ncbi:hypothetical protein BX600DRAFT_45820 [Xylariales sp. PMI_506]|nr:hypothetical protein BX600DRAFT_45820 [Xylariales sp. PMI_506]
MPFSLARARIGTVITEAMLESRQNTNTTDDEVPLGFVEVNGRVVPWWDTRTGLIVKWSIFLGLIVIMFAYLIGGRWHARRRINKGLAPMAYHRWLIPRAELARVDPRYAYPEATYTNYAPGAAGYYGMQPMPPPVYDPNRPPVYQGSEMPPTGATKVDPAQEYAPPPGPPPAAASREANPFSDPPRL